VELVRRHRFTTRALERVLTVQLAFEKVLSHILPAATVIKVPFSKYTMLLHIPWYKEPLFFLVKIVHQIILVVSVKDLVLLEMIVIVVFNVIKLNLLVANRNRAWILQRTARDKLVLVIAMILHGWVGCVELLGLQIAVKIRDQLIAVLVKVLVQMTMTATLFINRI
jgi:hypothetical protein